MTQRALVVGGGGVTGVAWEVGVLAGLADQGVDLTTADLVVGTSAGSVVGVDVRSGISLAEIYRRHLAPPAGEVAAKMRAAVLARYLLAVAFARNPARARRRLGALALRAKTMPEADRRKVIESRLPVREWPSGPLQITAVDAATGELTIFDAASGVGLADAVGASCAVPGIWPAVSIGGRRYIDGGMRSAANADLAAGYQQVIIIAPLTRGLRIMPGVRRQERDLVAGGSQVLVIEPDADALAAIGKNVLDPARRVAAARAGYAQAATLATAAGSIWLAGQPDPGGPEPDRPRPGLREP